MILGYLWCGLPWQVYHLGYNIALKINLALSTINRVARSITEPYVTDSLNIISVLEQCDFKG